MVNPGYLYFGVFGVKDGVTRTSSVISYKVEAGALTDGIKPPESTPSIYEKILKLEKEIAKKLDASELPTAINTALAQAKIVLTVNGIGADENGNVEIDATGGGGGTGSYYTPSVSASGELSWTPSSAGMPAVPPANITGPKGDTGPAGQNGVSATHSWAGTTLTVTSASGTSSADLKGDTGARGPAGADGYTPVKGTDYFTEADKTELVQAVLSALPAAEGVSY